MPDFQTFEEETWKLQNPLKWELLSKADIQIRPKKRRVVQEHCHYKLGGEGRDFFLTD